MKATNAKLTQKLLEVELRAALRILDGIERDQKPSR